MRTLKLQMRMTVDGFVADPEGRLDHMTVDLDDTVMNRLFLNAETSDTIIMGRKMAPGFLEHWEAKVDGRIPSPDIAFATKLVNTPKIIFSKTQTTTGGRNARIENRDLKTEVTKLKNGPGKDILLYGGATFASSLIKEDLIDEFYFLVVPVTLGKGMRIFNTMKKLKLLESTKCGNDVVINHYKLAR